jgi:hypothetical protein
MHNSLATTPCLRGCLTLPPFPAVDSDQDEYSAIHRFDCALIVLISSQGAGTQAQAELVRKAIMQFAHARNATRSVHLQTHSVNARASALRGASDDAALAVMGFEYEASHFGKLIQDCKAYE